MGPCSRGQDVQTRFDSLEWKRSVEGEIFTGPPSLHHCIGHRGHNFSTFKIAVTHCLINSSQVMFHHVHAERYNPKRHNAPLFFYYVLAQSTTLLRSCQTSGASKNSS